MAEDSLLSLALRSVPVRLGLAIGIGSLVCLIDCFTPADYSLSTIYLVLLVLTIRSPRRISWGIAILFVLYTVLGLLLGPQAKMHPGRLQPYHWLNRALDAISILVEAGLIQLLMGARQQVGEALTALEKQNARLQSTNDQLQTREGELDDQRLRLQTVLTTLPFGVIVANADLSEIQINPAGSKLLGMPDQEVSSFSRWPELAQLYRDGRELPLEEYPLARAVYRREVDPGTEYDLHFNARRFALLISAAPIIDRDGRITGGVSAFADVTEQRQMRDQLDARRRDAEDASIRKTRFLSALSHDIRNPVNAIGLLTEVILRDTSHDGTDPDLAESARELKATAESLARMLSDVLDLTRLDVGRYEVRLSDFSVQDLLNETCRTFATQARLKNLKFTCEDGDIHLRTDRIKLGRALANLTGNAIKFTETGEVRVQAALTPDGRVRFSIHDTGPGIPANRLDDIFDEFVQLHNPERDRDKGTGLGLSICRRIVDVLGGELKVESQVGQGSTFSILLPAETVAPPAGSVSPVQPSTPEKITD
jgi:signal transduction histidine kinase